MEITQISVRGTLYDIVDTKTTINGKTGEITANDIAAVLEGGGYDTTIPEWAKLSNKPTYTAAEVGLGNVGNYKAVSTSLLLGLTESELRYARENIGAGTSNFSGSYNDLENKPNLSIYLTEHLDISNKADKSELFSGSYNDLTNKPNLATVATTGSYNDLTDKPAIPTDLSQFSNNNSYYATENWVSDKINDILGINASGVDALKTALSDNDATTGILTAISNKVDKELGKGLSTNDFTDADKQKLANIASGAQAHVAPTEQEVKNALGVGSGTTKFLREDGTWQIVPDNDTTYNAATTSTDGLMSSTDKAKLDSINTATLLTQSDIPAWATNSTKPNYIYDEIGYAVTTVTTSGAISLVGTNPVYEVILDGNASSVSLSTNPSIGHCCHVIFTSTEARTVTIAHDAVNRICPKAEDIVLAIPANGYVEINFLNTNGKVYVRGI